MSIYAIGDTHLSFGSDKPMDIFGGDWVGHYNKLEKNWNEIVEDGDLVIIAGDISWGLKYEEALKDLEWIEKLNGEKVMIKGNHDLWWQGITKLRDKHKNLFFIQNNHAEFGDYAICGSRGWVSPGDSDFTESDDKIYKRELLRVERSLESAKQAKFDKIIAVVHYPPTNDKLEKSGFIDLFEKYEVEQVVYGHLHGERSFHTSVEGMWDGIKYSLVSIDYLRFTPLKIV